LDGLQRIIRVCVLVFTNVTVNSVDVARVSILNVCLIFSWWNEYTLANSFHVFKFSIDRFLNFFIGNLETTFPMTFPQ
jgi:hypothetical protein